MKLYLVCKASKPLFIAKTYELARETIKRKLICEKEVRIIELSFVDEKMFAQAYVKSSFGVGYLEQEEIEKIFITGILGKQQKQILG